MKTAFIQSLSALVIESAKHFMARQLSPAKIEKRMRTVSKRTARQWCVPFVMAVLLTGCASTPEQKAIEEQRRITEEQSNGDKEQKRWQQILAPYSDEQLRFKFAGLQQAIAIGLEGGKILLEQGNGIGVLIAQGQIDAKVKERDAVGLELIRRRDGADRPDRPLPGGNGSGFFITEDGYLLTNFHVVEDAHAVKVKHGGQLYNAEVVRKDRGADLAVLKVQGKFKPLPLVDSRSVKLGEKVFTLGFPKVSIQGEEPKFTEGSISGLYGFQDDSGQFQISVPIQPGNSGGALVNAAGQVVGIIVSKLPSGQNVNFAVKSNRARLLFDDVPEIQFTTTEPGVPLTQEQVAERLVNSTVLLLIY
jgi:S1-C subfamily serine protease